MKYIFLTTYNLLGSGYTAIVNNLSYGLHERGNEIMILGVGYKKQSHYHPFHIVPLESNWVMEALRVIPSEWRADRVIIAMDIPKLKEVTDVFIKHDMKSAVWGFEAIFPVESDPIKTNWRLSLSQYRQRYCISQYGTEICNSYELPTIHLPVGCMVGNKPKDKTEVRKMLGWDEHKPTFITVASNQERKALPIGLEAFKLLPKGTAKYYIITNPISNIGWDLPDLLNEYGLQDDVHIVTSDLSVGELSMHYWASDALIVISEAEGACLPIYEAASHGLPVICGHWTAMKDVSDQDWIFTIDSVAEYRHPWGNVKRWIASVKDVYSRMEQIIFMKDSEDYSAICELAINYAKSRKWETAVDIIEREYHEA